MRIEWRGRCTGKNAKLSYFIRLVKVIKCLSSNIHPLPLPHILLGINEAFLKWNICSKICSQNIHLKYIFQCTLCASILLSTGTLGRTRRKGLKSGGQDKETKDSNEQHKFQMMLRTVRWVEQSDVISCCEWEWGLGH